MPEPDIFQLDVLFIPINIGQFHWWCGLSVDFQEKRIQMFDSMGRGYAHYLDIVFECLKKVHNDIHGNPLPDVESWRKVLGRSDVPQQRNSKLFRI